MQLPLATRASRRCAKRVSLALSTRQVAIVARACATKNTTLRLRFKLSDCITDTSPRPVSAPSFCPEQLGTLDLNYTYTHMNNINNNVFREILCTASA